MTLLESIIGQMDDFVWQSNDIEGIALSGPERRECVAAHLVLLRLEVVEVSDLEQFVSVIAPHARLRVREGDNVTVGSHRPPSGGPYMRERLAALLEQLPPPRGFEPYFFHQMYETLHPFMDGNGRSGRALWLWQMLRWSKEPETVLERSFLHTWYYQSLG